MSEPSRAAESQQRPEARAGVALALGIMSLVCTGLFTGVPAIVLGLAAQRDLARTPGARGHGAAVAAVITGFVGTIVSIAAILIVVTALALSRHAAVAGGPHTHSPEGRQEEPHAPRHASTFTFGS